MDRKSSKFNNQVYKENDEVIDLNKWGVKSSIQINKERNENIIQALRRTGNLKDADKIEECAENAIYAVGNSKKDMKLKSAYFCRCRLCLVCNVRKAMVRYRELSEVISYIENQNDPVGCKYNYLFQTYTVKNVELKDVKNMERQLKYGLKKMFNRKRLKDRVHGRYTDIEITYNQDRDDYHVHAHTLLMVSNSLINGMNRVSIKEYRNMFQKSMKLDYVPIVDSKLLKTDKDNNTLKTVLNGFINYVSKKNDIYSMIAGLDEKETRKVLNGLNEQLRFQRKVTFSGLFKEVKKEIEKSKSSSNKNKLLNTGVRCLNNQNEKPMFEPSQIIVCGWKDNKMYVSKTMTEEEYDEMQVKKTNSYTRGRYGRVRYNINEHREGDELFSKLKIAEGIRKGRYI